MNRREVLKKGASAFAIAAAGTVRGANAPSNRVRLGIVACARYCRGQRVLGHTINVPGVEIAYACDVLESARNDKRIGKPLEAAVTLRADDGESAELLNAVSDMDLSDLLIVSRCLVGGEDAPDAVTGSGAKNPGLHISVVEAPGTKCPRCWKHSLEADSLTELCPRCAGVVAKL